MTDRGPNNRGVTYVDVESCVEATLTHVGKRILLGTPLGLGKANHLVNEFYRRACDDTSIDLRIFTALTLARPRWKSDLERRFVEPLNERLFGDYPELAYVDPMRRGELPANIRVNEFYFQPGAFLGSPFAQREYVSTNYTHVVRDVLDAGINVLAQLVASDADDHAHLSLSCNPDLTLPLVPQLRERERRGERIALLAEVNRNLPYMYGDAEVAREYFDGVVDARRYDCRLFAPPNGPVSTADYLIALYVSALIPDGGTLQLGIGSLGDAIAYVLKLRHEQNATYRRVLDSARVLDRFGEIVERLGGTGTFAQGLYASTEMLVDGFLELIRSGVLKRRVAPGSHVAHACFFLGPERFYEALRRMPRAEREQICMTGIDYVNELYGNEELKRRQRVQARFVNTGLVVSLSGAVASDALDDGRIVSGVGGQYNFVAMAHALDDGRSILLIRSTHGEGRKAHSNVVANYGSTTIPRHLRDIVVTEYGIADIRGKTNEEVARALIEIADARFQDALIEQARSTGTISTQYHNPDTRRNTQDRLESILAPFRVGGLFPEFPFGTDFTPDEIVLMKALGHLESIAGRKRFAMPKARDLHRAANVPETARPYLERMGLAEPQRMSERAMQRALAYALAAVGAI
ncbi:MAG TPA: acetyl-CoA hydrolase/transferase C-terminal domain-containing protein [Gemmatimonadaceae bacterium]